jgi:hypothetical protein
MRLSLADIIIIAVNIGCFAIFILKHLGFKKLIEGYMNEKGKNLATKQDIAEITRATEAVKQEFNNKLVKLTEEVRFQKYKEQQVYLQKIKAINESLDLIDEFISYRMDTNITPYRKDVIYSDFTVKARDRYNALVVVCDDKRILDLFLDIVLCKEGDPIVKWYNDYRNYARKELGLEPIQKIDNNRIFISRIDLSRNYI